MGSSETSEQRLVRLERDLDLSRQLLDITAEVAAAGVWRVDLVKNVVEWSERIFEIVGLDPSTFRPTLQNAIECYHPDERAGVESNLANALRQGSILTHEGRIVRPDGQIRQVFSYGRPEFDHDGNIIAISGTFQDVTDQRRDETAFRQSRDRLRVHLEHTPLAIIEWDTNFHILEWNARAEELFGYTRAEALGKHGSQLIVPPEYRAEVDTVFQELLQQRGGSHHINENITRDGRRLTCEWYNTPLVGPDGVPYAAASICRDMTEQKRLEAQLVQTQKMEAVGTLAGGLAHDVNNVLAVVMGLGSVVREALPEDSALHTDMTAILTAAERGRAMVNNLLGFARKGAYTQTRWSPRTIIEPLTQLLEKTIPKEVSVRAQIAPDVPDVVGDANQLSTALLNLSINSSQAIVARGAGRGTITLLADSVSISAVGSATDGARTEHPEALPPGRWARIRVQDDGQGMDATTLERACEPFFTTKAIGEGTGLGLSMAYGAVSAHEGHLHITSVPGRGTTVSVYLPAASSSSPELPVPNAGTSYQPRRILVIDDEQLVLRSVRRQLQTAGHDVTVARGGKAGLASFKAHGGAFDLVLLDVSMPDMNGVECLAALRDIQPDVAAVFCTGHGDANLTEGVRKAGVRAVLPKPYSRAELLELVARTAN